MTATNQTATKEIAIGDATIIITSPTSFDIWTPTFDYTGYTVPSTADIDSIKKILENPDWHEYEINEAIDALNTTPEEIEQNDRHNRALDARIDREDA